MRNPIPSVAMPRACVMLPRWPRPSLEMGLGEVVVLLTDWYAESQHAHESIVGVVVDVGDATAGEYLEVVTDEQAVQHDHGRARAQLLDVEADPVGGYLGHERMNSTRSPTVSAMI